MESVINKWVDSNKNENEEFKRVVRIILKAISMDEHLSQSMIMKGGILLGVKYNSSRHTTDIDFSSEQQLSEFDIESFTRHFDNMLSQAIADLAETIHCRIQSIKRQPKDKNATFPSLKISIGYSSIENTNKFKRLQKKQSPTTISIDYSFNEITGNTDIIEISPDYGESIKVYQLEAIISEKYRSLLQQVVRNRNRQQDVYDLYYLITNYATHSIDEKYLVLSSLIEKSKGKGIEKYLNSLSLETEEIKNRSLIEYHLLSDTVRGVLPDKEIAYKYISEYYKSLPWDK